MKKYWPSLITRVVEPPQTFTAPAPTTFGGPGSLAAPAMYIRRVLQQCLSHKKGSQKNDIFAPFVLFVSSTVNVAYLINGLNKIYVYRNPYKEYGSLKRYWSPYKYPRCSTLKNKINKWSYYEFLKKNYIYLTILRYVSYYLFVRY